MVLAVLAQCWNARSGDEKRIDWLESNPKENIQATEWTWRQPGTKSVREAIDRNMEAEARTNLLDVIRK